MRTLRNSKIAEERALAEKLLKSKLPLARAAGKARMARMESGEGFMTREQIMEQIRRSREGH